MKKHIPNFLTCMNLLSGCFALVALSDSNFILASYLILLAALFDFADGMAARLLNVSSPIGKELDSLADVISFGLVPAFLAVMLLVDAGYDGWQIYLPLCIAIFSALRLAKFNIDERQTSSFIGLPTPANALFWLSIPLILRQLQSHPSAFGDFLTAMFTNNWFIIIAAIVLSLLLVAELPLFSLKFKSMDFKSNIYRYLLLGISLLLIAAFYFIAIPFILILYLLLSFIQTRIPSKNEI